MSPLEILAVLGAVALVLAPWLPPRARRPALLGAAAVVAAAGTAIAVLGPRWQLAPLFTGAALALAATALAAARRRSGRNPRRARRWPALTGSAACLVLIAATPAASWAMPVPVYPEPSGPHAVGTAVLQWTDEDRPEPFTEDPDDRRTVVVQLWYPARDGAPEADRAYGGRETAQEARAVAEASAELFGVPGFLLDPTVEARSHAVFDAPPAAGGERYPVVVFSPGLSATRTANTVLAEEWASRGYAVATVDHPYDAAVTFVDGEPVHSRNAVAATDAATAQGNRDNLAMRAADLGFVLTQLERLDRGEVPGPLAGRLDTGRAAVAGHSRGAAAALTTAAADPRFAAAVHIDGGLEPSLPPGPFHQPALSVTSPVSAAENPGYLPELERALERGTAENHRVALTGAGHYSFVDAALYFPPLPSLLGTAGRTEGLRLTAEAVALFLDAVLRGAPTDLAEALPRYGAHTVYK